jgi:hypothetical protein
MPISQSIEEGHLLGPNKVIYLELLHGLTNDIWRLMVVPFKSVYMFWKIFKKMHLLLFIQKRWFNSNDTDTGPKKSQVPTRLANKIFILKVSFYIVISLTHGLLHKPSQSFAFILPVLFVMI